MTFAFHRSQVITTVALFATAAIAFCIGRLTNSEGPQSASGSHQETSTGGATPGGKASSPATGNAPSASRGAQFASAENSGPLTVARLTNGQPLEKWMKNLMAQEDGIVRMTGLLRLIDAVTDPADLRTALEAINLRGDRSSWRNSRYTEYSMLLEKWTQLEAKGAIAYVEGRSREERFIGASAVLRTWTRLDPAAAIAWAEAKGESVNPTDGGPGGPGGPGGWSYQGNFALSSVISQLAHSDLDRALTLASTQSFDERSRALDTIASELVTQRGLKEARTALDSLPEGNFRDGLSMQLARRFAAEDAKGTAQWVLTMPEGETRSRALRDVVSEWAKNDPTAAGNFLTSLPATPEGDRSRESYASSVVEKDPAGAMAWANAITDDERRLRALENVARSWMRTDAAAAKAWITQSTLPDEVKTRIQSPPSGGGGFGFGASRGRGRGGTGN